MQSGPLDLCEFCAGSPVRDRPRAFIREAPSRGFRGQSRTLVDAHVTRESDRTLEVGGSTTLGSTVITTKRLWVVHHKRKRPKNGRARCLLCKPWNANGNSRRASDALLEPA